ncbi:MAG: AIR synthase-related protein [archaeon]
MPHRIEVMPKIEDSRALDIKKKINALGFSVDDVGLVEAYNIDADLTSEQLDEVVSMLVDPVFETARVNEPIFDKEFDSVVEIGFHPGVTDNVGRTARDGIIDKIGIEFEDQGVFSSRALYLKGNISGEDAVSIGESFANTLIQKVRVKSQEEFRRDKGMGIRIPKVQLEKILGVDVVNILNAPDSELELIGKAGILDSRTNERRGPLALVDADGDLTYMNAIKDYMFNEESRNPTDIELESIAQTWSEHCKHTIFGDPMDEIEEGLMKRYIKGATEKISEIKRESGERDDCISVFSDNAGIIEFDENNNLCIKVETHNSPSALDPYGGAITGIVGVNRDPFGSGMGAKLVYNLSGPFGVGLPDDKRVLYKGKNFTQKMLSPRRLLDGIVDGVRDGGNQSGIPTAHFSLVFESRYKLDDSDEDYQGYGGKPIVPVGSAGIMPKEINGKPSHLKKAVSGDYIVMVGGRIGKDGIHGATFSSEEMDSGSPATAVQIGDAFTQKKMHDALLEARDLGLYRSITDNGAGGLSCSVGEMAKESGGFEVQLEKAPVKYQGLAAWEKWISEAQERMTLAVPEEKWSQLEELLNGRDVEATIIGRFTDSGRAVVYDNGSKIMDLDMDFLHDGAPKRPMKTALIKRNYQEPDFECLADLTDSLHAMLSRPNITSIEFINQQYDYEVQGSSVIKPLQGRGRVNANAIVFKPVLDSKKAVAISQGYNPFYSDISAYDMAACAIDSAIANAVSVGAKLKNIRLLDNFFWSSSKNPHRLGQLKEACRACYDYAVGYLTSFISGKDSMFNDFKGYDENGNPIKISVPPALLITATAVMDDATKAVSLDFKNVGDLVYVLGYTRDELGASEYFAMKGEEIKGQRYIGNSVPKVDLEKNMKTYEALEKAIDEELVASCQSVGLGGLGVALSKSAIAGNLGLEASFENLACDCSRDDFALYSQSQGRLVVSIAPEYRERFEELMQGTIYSLIGQVKEDTGFSIKGMNGKEIIDSSTESVQVPYKLTFEDF